MTQISPIVPVPLSAPSANAVGVASPSRPTATNGAPASDIVSIGNSAARGSRFSVEVDNAAADVSAVTDSLKGAADHLNSMQGFLDPDVMKTMRVILGDQGAEKWLAGIKQHIADTEKNLTQYEAHAEKTYGVSGRLPTKNDDGSWSHGLFSLSSRGSGFVARADSSGAVAVSVAGQAFVSWAPPQSDARAANGSSASIALQTLKGLNKLA